MTQTANSSQKFRLRPADVAAWFRHRCDRNFRWNTVPAEHRERAGIGWNVPKRARKHTRPGVALLMNTGNNFEADSVDTLLQKHGAAQVLCAGFASHGESRTVQALPFDQFLATLQQTPLPRYIAQLEISLEDEAAARFLNQFALDAQQVSLSVAKPDLLEVLPPTEAGQPYKLRIWDYKASAAARHEHYIQVAYYSLLLDFALRTGGFTHVIVDLDYGVIRSREPEPEIFELAPYRLAVSEYLREYVPPLLATAASDAHFHVEAGCMLCEYADHCRAEADAGHDLSRIAYLTSEARRRLRQLGIKTHRELARLNDDALIQQARTACYDLGLNLDRYIATAQALEDGQPRPLGAMTLMMPQYENVRIVITAEHDPVTNSCFALGLKTFEGWDAANNRVIGDEQVFIAREKGQEAEILFAFLRVLNDKLESIDAANRPTLALLSDAQTRNQTVSSDPQVSAAQQQLDAAQAALEQFKQRVPRLKKTNPDYERLHQDRESLKDEVKAAEQTLKQAQKDALWRVRQQLRTVHFYLYDSIDLLYLRALIERNLFRDEPAGLLAQMTRLVRLFPTESVIPDAFTFRSMPGTVVTQVLRAMIALPTPYQFDLKSVSQTYQPHKATGEENGFVFRAKYGFAWDSSNQVAFERIHDVWNNEHYAVEGQFDLTPAEVVEQIEKTLRAKLRATDSVVRRLKQQFGNALRLRKEPFQLYGDFNPLQFQTLEALRVFAIIENSLDELSIKHTHTLPVEDRNNKFVCIRGLQFIPDSTQPDGSLWFTFDPASRDAKFEVGNFNLVLTNEAEPDTLIGKIDGKLFDQTTNYWLGYYKVRLEEFDHSGTPPRLRLLPDKPDKFQNAVNLAQPCVLDQLYSDYNTPKILDVLSRLHADPTQAQHVHDLLRDGIVTGWQPVVMDSPPLEQQLKQLATQTGKNEQRLLNEGQWHALHGVFQEPLTLVWGPPGTGKTHTLAHILLAYALAAQRGEQKMRLLVTAFTHHAIANVMKKVAELANDYGLGDDVLLLLQIKGSDGSAYQDLPERVLSIEKKELETHLNRDNRCVVVGSTVWGLYSGMDAAGRAVRQWFDVMLVDEASQMKLPDALAALSASKVNSNIILAGDDQQLPPIIHGTYPEEHEHLLTSVFAFVRHQVEAQQAINPHSEARRLFQLEDNFRMNEPLTAYPRNVLYRGRFQSMRPLLRLRTEPALAADSTNVLNQLLLPERPVVLCWYTAPQSFTARNPIEAELVAELTEMLRPILWDEQPDGLFTPADFATRGLAVLSPHRAQNSAIRQALRDKGYDTPQRPLPSVDTVDKLQGKEREVILVSYGVADSEYAMAEAAFLLGSNRFNVAVTRAQKKVVVFCSEQVLNVVPPDRQVLLDSMMLKEFRHYCNDGHITLPWQSVVAGDITLHIQWKGF